MLLVGLVHMIDPSYGAEFLRLMSSIYPGADTSPTLARVLIGALYGLPTAPSRASYSVYCMTLSLAERKFFRSK